MMSSSRSYVCVFFKSLRRPPRLTLFPHTRRFRPPIKKRVGAEEIRPHTFQATLTRTIHKKTGRLHFMSAIVSWDGRETTVTPAEEQGSGVLKSTVYANGLLVFPLEKDELQSGEQVTVQLLDV